MHLMCPADTNERLDWVQFAVHRALRKYKAIFRSKKNAVRYDRGYMKRFVNHGKSQFRNAKRNHKNGLEGFSWDSLKAETRFRQWYQKRIVAILPGRICRRLQSQKSKKE